MNTKEKLLSINPVKTKAVKFHDTEIYIKKFNGHERAALLAHHEDCQKSNRISDMVIWAVLLGVSELNGDRVFSDLDFNKVANMLIEDLDYLSNLIMDWNGISNVALDDAKKN